MKKPMQFALRLSNCNAYNTVMHRNRTFSLTINRLKSYMDNYLLDAYWINSSIHRILVRVEIELFEKTSRSSSLKPHILNFASTS